MTFGDLFKTREREFDKTINYPYIGIRIDGRAFHTFTRQFEKPYDLHFMKAMDNATMAVLENLGQAMFGYVQSDEISVILPNNNEPLFSGRIQKLVSVSSGAATGGLYTSGIAFKGFPVFDSRVFGLNDLHEVFEYIDWRRIDARKNAVSSAAQEVVPKKALHNVRNGARLELLKGTIYERLPEGFMNGRLILSTKVVKTVEYKDKRDSQIHTVEALRTELQVLPARRNTLKEWFEKQ